MRQYVRNRQYRIRKPTQNKALRKGGVRVGERIQLIASRPPSYQIGGWLGLQAIAQRVDTVRHTHSCTSSAHGVEDSCVGDSPTQ
jgi:hypothetical protein